MRWQGMGESVWLRGGKRELGSWRVGNIKRAEVWERGKARRVLYAANARMDRETEKPSEGLRANEG